jgi:2-methylisocitrate lyase-like PEP mutase family enzyme
MFRDLHARPPLVLPNAWDVGSAVAIEAAGARTIATTSAGVSWAVGVPVTADIEAGYGVTPEEVASTVSGCSRWEPRA